jgi:hypothetical protein
MADIRAQHIKTGEIKNLPEKVFKQVQHKYKFLSYVDDPNVQPPQPQGNVAAQAVVDNMAGVAKVTIVSEDVVTNVTGGDYTLDKQVEQALTPEEETLEQLRLRYAAVTGKKPGNKSKLTLQKELNDK